MYWKIYNFLIAILFYVGLKTQPIITDANLPKANDFFYTSITISMLDSSYFQSGGNQVWDFSQLGHELHDTLAFFNVISSQVPITYASVFYNPLDPAHKATVCLKGDNFQLGPTIQATNVFYFFKLNQNAFVQVGIGATINGMPTPIKFNPTDTIFHLPLQYNSSDNTYSFFEVNIPSLGYFCEHRWRNYTADAYGQVITPIGTFEALRVKTNLQYKDSIYYQQYGIGFSINRNETMYEWYTPSFSIPIIKITQNMQENRIEYIDTTNYTVLENYLTTSLLIYPNPGSTFLQIISKNEPIKTIHIQSITGQSILEQSLDAKFHHTIDVRNIPSGVYFLVIQTTKEKYTKKLIIQR